MAGSWTALLNLETEDGVRHTAHTPDDSYDINWEGSIGAIVGAGARYFLSG